MAMFKGGTGGILSGMVGNVVVVNYRNGKVVLRTAPRKRKFTELQKQNWKRFSALTSFWGQFGRSQIQQIWQVAEEGRRGINLFINANSPAFNPEGVLEDISRLHFSAGKLPLPYKLTAQRAANNPLEVEVTWRDNQGGLARSDDELMMMAAHEGKFTGPLATGAKRNEETAMIQLPTVSGSVEGIYLFFASEKRKMYSKDQYFSLVTG
jgi:hypothetical protein